MDNRIIFLTQARAIINATNFSTIAVENNQLLLDNKYVLGYYKDDEMADIIQRLTRELGKTRKAREPLVFVMPLSSENDEDEERTADADNTETNQ